MVDVVRVDLDRAAIRALESDPNIHREVLAAAKGMGRAAAAAAPKRSGAGAASIGPFPADDDRTAVNVSWESRAFYMVFHEDGTKLLPDQHFLLGAFERYIHT